MIKRILNWLFPEKCVLCRRILRRDELDLCRKCRTDSPEFDKRRKRIKYVDEMTAVWYYEGNVRQSLLRYKFRGVIAYAGAYGRLLAMRIIRDLPDGIDVVTWVPIGPKRLRKRGYDQGKELAKQVALELELPMERLLRKPRDNKAQSGIATAEARRANVLGVYELAGSCKDKSILLLDDILTTGSTVSECARVMKTAGAKNVYCAAVAAGRNEKQ